MTELSPAEAVFFAALEKPSPAERVAYLDNACAGQPELRARVEKLLAAQPRIGEFLQENAAPEVTATFSKKDNEATTDYSKALPGTLIAGRYKLLQQIGEGGMGTVWMADQTEPVKRKVAVKLIRVERGLSKTILARFEAERQAIALMDHPHIAKLLDAGTTDTGSPFFVMELVKGIPLNEYCDQHKLTIPERLSLFQQICSAVQHAHQKGIIHRDLKPGNILVESHDGKPVPKVIDFGLAKATTGLQLSEHSMFTAFGSVMGTPLYMAPEQATFNAIDVDTRADVYALGVILYEMLTGTTPITRDTLKKAALDEMLKLIREQEAPSPSSRLSSADSLPSVSANRQTEPTKLGRFVKGELDWIVLKALSKERDRRYETANGFARDIERFLNHEPVTAGPVTAAYRMRKFVRRNRGQVIAAGLVLATLVVGIVGTTWGLLRAVHAEQKAKDDRDSALRAEIDANNQRSRAQEEKKASDAVRAFLQNDLLRKVDMQFQASTLGTGAGGLRLQTNPTVRELLDRAAAQLAPDSLQVRFPNMPFVQAEILRAVGSAYSGIGEYQLARPLLVRAVELYTTARGPSDFATITARKDLAVLLVWSGQEDSGLRELEVVCQETSRIIGVGNRETIQAQFDLAFLYYHYNKFDKLLPLLTHLHQVTVKEFGAEDFDSLLAAGYFAFIQLRMGKNGEKSLAQLEWVWHEFHRRRLRLEHPSVQNIGLGLSIAYRMSGQEEKSRKLLEDSLRVWEEVNDGDNPATWQYRHQLAFDHYINVGKVEEGVALLERNIKAAAQPFDEIAIEGLYVGYLKVGRLKEALAQIDRVLALVEQRMGQNQRSYLHGRIRTRKGIVLVELGQFADAEGPLVDGYRELIDHLAQQPSFGKGDPANAVRAIVRLYKQTNKPIEVAKWEEELAKISEVKP